MLPISSNCGLPICLTGISRPLLLPQEMDDHERRREIMKKKKFQEVLQLHEMIRAQNGEASANGSENREGDVNNGKITVATNEFCPCISLPCTAKAA